MTGKTQAYEELWTDLDITSTDASTAKVCVVLRLDATAQGVRGVVVRSGGWCQGVLVKGSDVTVERWEFVGSGQKGEWKRRVRIGGAFLPCAVGFQTENVRIGGLVKYFDYEWRVEEVVEWTDE